MALPVRFLVEIVSSRALIARCLDADLALEAASLRDLERRAFEAVCHEFGADRIVSLLIGSARL
jgi:hypothetical protein